MIRVECPAHEGAFDCTPFCSVCEGEQEYEHTAQRPCVVCADPVEHDIWYEELGLCVDCSNDYFRDLGEDDAEKATAQTR